jgi:hypothetical protein
MEPSITSVLIALLVLSDMSSALMVSPTTIQTSSFHFRPRGFICLPNSKKFSARTVRASSFDIFEKDVVEFLLVDEDGAKIKQAVDLGSREPESRTMLGAILEPRRADGFTSLQPLCVREQGSKELYGDSRLQPLLVQADQILRVSVLTHLIPTKFFLHDLFNHMCHNSFLVSLSGSMKLHFRHVLHTLVHLIPNAVTFN